MVSLVKELCVLNGVSGDEGQVREFIIDKIKGSVDSLEVDALGNIIAFKKGESSISKRIMLCAHMDEVGLIITGFGNDGFLKFSCVGGIDKRVLLGRKVTIGEKGIPGVIGNKAVHMAKADEKKTAPDVESMYIDIGCTSRTEAQKLVSIGDTGAFDGSVFEFGDGMLKAKAIDDRVGCGALIKIIENGNLPADCYFAFTVQEEVGTRGAAVAAYRTAPDIALVVEGTTAADLPSVPENKKICSPGDGIVIPFMDGGTIYDRGIFKMLTEIADKNGIKWQTKTMIAGGTDGAAIQRSRAGVKTGGIACAIRNIHSPASVASINDFERMLKLITGFLVEIGERYKCRV